MHGGWLPLLVAAVVIVVMTTWQRGRRIVTARRTDLEGPLQEFLDDLPDGIVRVPGTAVFPHPTKETAPLALRANVEFNHVLHERVLIVSLVPTSVPHVPVDQRLTVDDLKHPHDGIVHVSARFGFQDVQDVPGVLRQACGFSPSSPTATRIRRSSTSPRSPSSAARSPGCRRGANGCSSGSPTTRPPRPARSDSRSSGPW